MRTVHLRRDAATEALDPGEREAIQLAEEHHANLLLIDERRRLEAKRRGISTLGALGILLAGGERGLIEPEEVFQRLVEQTNFRASSKLVESFATQCRELRRQK